jgi:hypothetical protein
MDESKIQQKSCVVAALNACAPNSQQMATKQRAGAGGAVSPMVYG